MTMWSTSLVLFFVKYLLFLVTFTRAMYYIDDTNRTAVQYIPGNCWLPISETGSFNDTVTFTFGDPSDICHFKIPFTGSGISIYVWIPNTSYIVNVSIVIDGSPPTIETILPRFDSTIYNISLFNIQDLPFSGHIVDITPQYYFFFDYAAINDTQPSPSPASSTGWTGAPMSKSNPSLGSMPTSAKSSKKHTNSIIGGIVGGLATVVVAGAALFFCRRRKKLCDQTMIDSGPDPKITSFNASVDNAAADMPRILNATVAPNIADNISYIPSNSNIQMSVSPHEKTSNARIAAGTQLANVPLLNTENSAIAPLHNPAASSPLPSASTSTPSARANRTSSAQLTAEQIVTLQTLHRLNTQAAEIVGVMERMGVLERQTSGSSEGDDYPMEDLPGYDLVSPGGLQ